MQHSGNKTVTFPVGKLHDIKSIPALEPEERPRQTTTLPQPGQPPAEDWDPANRPDMNLDGSIVGIDALVRLAHKYVNLMTAFGQRLGCRTGIHTDPTCGTNRGIEISNEAEFHRSTSQFRCVPAATVDGKGQTSVWPQQPDWG